jgi:phosphoglycolate phosphatase
MQHYTTYLFDLDGTLTDPRTGITKSVLYALDKLGIPEAEPKRLETFIGPPLLESFKKSYGLSDDKARQAVTYYREYFTDVGIFENNVYEGIGDLLSRLDVLGCQLALATSKPTIYAERILEHFSLRQYFDLVVGSNMDLTRVSKDEIITEVLRVLRHAKPSGIMIGDRAEDIMAAKVCMIDSIAVGYGYGSEEELSDTKPTYIVHTVDELSTLLLRFASR